MWVKFSTNNAYLAAIHPRNPAKNLKTANQTRLSGLSSEPKDAVKRAFKSWSKLAKSPKPAMSGVNQGKNRASWWKKYAIGHERGNFCPWICIVFQLMQPKLLVCYHWTSEATISDCKMSHLIKTTFVDFVSFFEYRRKW